MIRKIGVMMMSLFCATSFAQEFEIKQDDDDVLFFNQSEQTVEVWVRMQQMAISEVVKPGEMKKFVNSDYLTKED